MHIIHVFLHVKADKIEAFKTLTLDNARNSRKEPGCVRFDVLQQQDDPTKFEFVEIYKDVSDLDHHKTTEHYARWSDGVGDLLVEPRTRNLLTNVDPADADY
jgi:autoinducer 2-degrading protein